MALTVVKTTALSGTITNAQLAGSIDLTSKVTGALPAANGGTGVTTYTPGKILKVQSYSNGNDTTSTSSSFSTFYTASFTPTSASSTILFVLAYNYQLYGNSSSTDADGKINITSEATGSSVVISQQEFAANDMGNNNTFVLEQSGCMQGTQASSGTSAFDITLRLATRGTGRIRVFETDGDAVNPIVLTVYEIGA